MRLSIAYTCTGEVEFIQQNVTATPRCCKYANEQPEFGLLLMISCQSTRSKEPFFSLTAPYYIGTTSRKISSFYEIRYIDLIQKYPLYALMCAV